jgi:TolB-like protein
MAGSFQEIKERRIVQILVSYAVAGWVVLSVFDQLADRGVVPELVYRVVLVFYMGGFFAALVFGWYHGEKGAQEFTRKEITLHTIGSIVTLVIAGLVVHRGLQTPDTSVMAGAGSLDPTSIAVLYFQNATGDDELQYVADGLTESLIGELADVSSLSVISANGSEQYRETDLELDSIARALGTGTLVTGTVGLNRDEIRINVALVDGESGTEFQRAAFNQPRDQVLELQGTLAQEVSVLLRGWLGEEITVRQRSAGTENAAAWALLQRGERALRQAEEIVMHGEVHDAYEFYDRADSLFAAAAEMDPNWVEPVSRRARVIYRLGRLEGNPVEADTYFQDALALSTQAIEMDARNADAWETRGTTRFVRWFYQLEQDSEAAEALLNSALEDLNRATEINPRQAQAWAILANVHYTLDDTVMANLAARRAYEADAYLASAESVLWRLWSTSYDLEIDQQSVAWCQEGFERFPENPRFYECQLWNMTSGAVPADPTRGWELKDELLQRTPEHQRERAALQADIILGGVLALANMPDSARTVLANSQGNAEIDPIRELDMTRAFAYLLLEDNEAALRELGRYLAANPERREGFAEHGHWWWSTLRNDPGFRQLVGTN